MEHESARQLTPPKSLFQRPNHRFKDQCHRWTAEALRTRQQDRIYMLLMIDNYDSFTYNLVQYFAELGAEVEVVRNDQIAVEEIERINPRKIVISPGPCTPKEAGISVETIRHYAGHYPILGVCLGHQSIGYAFGGKIIHASRIMHGKTSMVYHHDTGVFRGLNNPFQATR
jgi:anthranilate synthase component II